ncbi:MAG: peptide deformylase [Clostridiales Family XIII bacterium]|jgi:peptide deformylase|nr:peptide deformylase [Clostridiales Family XIII bacterium]
MALRAIVVDGDDILRKKSKEVKKFGERTHTLLDDMWETMRDANGVGLAAPQVGVLRRAVVIDVTDPERDDDDEGATPGGGDSAANAAAASDSANAAANAADAANAATADDAANGGAAAPRADVPDDLPVNAPGGFLYELLNPTIVEADGESLEKEGCLSVPGIVGLVRRPERVTVKAVGRDGGEITVKGEGILAKALSHEIDHLEGVLFTDIAEETEKLGRRASEDEEEYE